MIVSWLLKSRSKSILLTIIVTLLISACSSENSAAAAHSNASDNGKINSTKSKDTSSTTTSSTDPVVTDPVTTDPVTEPDTTPTDTTTGTTTTNSPAVISGTDKGSVTEDLDSNNDGLLSASGKLNISDSDVGEAAFIAKTVNSSYGSITIDAAGNWFYGAINTLGAIQNLNTNETLTDSAIVSSIDGTTHTVVITINGVDDTVPGTAAVISGTDTGSVTEDNDPDGDNLLEVSGKLNISDNDAGEAAFIAKTVNSSYGSITIDAAGNWFYGAINTLGAIQNLNTNETLTDSAIVSSIDGTTHTVVITINGVDDTVPGTAAVISGTDTGSVTEDNDPDGDNLLEVSGKLNISDNDAGEAAFIAETVNNGYGSLTIDTTGNWSYAASNSQGAIQDLTSTDTLSENYTVSSVDGTTHTVVITIVGTDEANGTVADVALSWVAPAEREDNTAISLSEIAGYKIYYGTTQGSYNNSVDINDGSAQSYTFASMPAGTYYFVITTRDVDGRESQFSSEVVIVI